MTTQLLALVNSAIAFGTVIMLGAMGEILIEKAGNLNLGIPGIMYLGAIGGLIAAFFYELGGGSSPVVGLLLSFLCCILFAAFGGLIYAFLTITLRANQNVTGLTLTIFGGGVANFFGGSLNKLAGGVGQISVPVTSSAYIAYTKLGYMGTVGKLLFAHGFMAYLAIVLAVVLAHFLNRTRTGLNLRAVGESPATADAAGYSDHPHILITSFCLIPGLSNTHAYRKRNIKLCCLHHFFNKNILDLFHLIFLGFDQ